MNDSSSLGRRELLLAGLGGTAGAALNAGSSDAKKVRYGVVGCGNRGLNTHLAYLKRFVPEVQVAAICDITPEALQTAKDFCSGAAAYSDYRLMLAEHPEIDAVVVVVPNYKHAEISVAALEAGKHVLVEKPMATKLADADHMIAAARKRKLALQVGMQCRYNELFAGMSQLIRQGAIGDVDYVFASIFRGDWNPKSWKYTDPATGKKTNWRYLTKTAGSSLMEDGIHELDVIHWMMGCEPTRIQAQGGNNVFKDRETIDHAGLLVEFANGATLTFGFTIYGRSPVKEVFRVFGSKGELSFEGAWYNSRGAGEFVIQPYNQPASKAERISLSYLRPEEKAWQEAGTGPGAAGHEQRAAPGFDPGSVRQHKAFIKSITTGAPVFADGKVGRDAVHIALAAERSVRTGRVFRWNDEEELL